MKTLALRISLSLSVIYFALPLISCAATVQVTAPFIEQGPGDFNGTLVLTFNVDGLPLTYNPTTSTSVPITDVTTVITFQNGSSDSGSSGSGAITTFGPGYDQLTFGAGDVSGIFVVPGNYDGTQNVLAGGPFVGSSFLRVAGRDNNVDGGTSTVLPEPSMMSLAAIGIFGFGLTRLMARRKKV